MSKPFGSPPVKSSAPSGNTQARFLKHSRSSSRWRAPGTLLCIGLVGASATLLASSTWAGVGDRMSLQTFDTSSPPRNKEGIGYPTYYQGGTEGGPMTITVDPDKKIGGASSLKLTLTSGYQFYPHWNPYDGVSRDFARTYSANPIAWKYNTYNRLRLWFFVPSNGGAEKTDGQTNFYVGTYVKRVTNADRSSDEAGGGHYYHGFNVLRNQWSMSRSTPTRDMNAETLAGPTPETGSIRQRRHGAPATPQIPITTLTPLPVFTFRRPGPRTVSQGAIGSMRWSFTRKSRLRTTTKSTPSAYPIPKRPIAFSLPGCAQKMRTQ